MKICYSHKQKNMFLRGFSFFKKIVHKEKWATVTERNQRIRLAGLV